MVLPDLGIMLREKYENNEAFNLKKNKPTVTTE
jgi:hypothetical protein